MKTPPLPKRIKWLYSLGDLAASAPLSFMAFFQLIFLTDVAGLRPDLAGYAVLIGKTWDSINDPFFGFISDRIQSKHGRRRIVLLYTAIPFGLTFFLQFSTPDISSQIGLLIYYSITIILFDTLYTAFYISFNALTPAITSDYDQQSALNGTRMTFALSGSLISIAIATLLIELIPDKQMLYRTLGIVIGLIAIIPIFIVFQVTAPYDTEKAPQTAEPVNFWASIKSILKNRPFLYLIGLYFFSWTTAGLTATVLIYFVNYHLLKPEHASYIAFVAQFSAIVFIPFWVWLAQKYDKRRAFIAGSTSWAIVLLGLALIQPGQIVLMYLVAVLSGGGIATAYFLPWAMIPDVVEADALENGQRREGQFYAFIAFFQKLGFGVAIWGFGQALAASDYITPNVSAANLPVQPAAAIQAIRIMIGVVPASLLGIAVIFAWFYPITRESFAQIREQLDQREIDQQSELSHDLS